MLGTARCDEFRTREGRHKAARNLDALGIDKAMIGGHSFGGLISYHLGVPIVGEYLSQVKAAPYFDGWWDPAIEEYYRNDLRINRDGTVQTISKPEHIQAAAMATLDIDWSETVRRLKQRTLLLRAPDPLGSPEVGPVVTREVAEWTLGWIEDSVLVEVPGNHVTFIFGDSADRIVDEIVGCATG